MAEDLTFHMGKFPALLPGDLRYARNHMWCRPRDSCLRFGFTSYAVRLMQDGGFRHVPVVSEAGKVVGVVSRFDFQGLEQDRLDEELLRSVATEAGDGLSVISAPDSIMPLESVDTDDLLRVIRLLRQQYGYVVLDLPANWTNWTLSAALVASSVLLVVELSVASLRQAQRRLELFRSVGIDEQAIEIVVNRTEKRLFRAIDIQDVSKTLRHSVLGTVALDAPAVSAAQNRGVLVGNVHRKSRFAQDIGRLGETMRAGRLSRAQ